MEVEIGRGKKARRAYGFDDIAIVPSRRTRDPDDIDISWKLADYRFELPLLASAMDGVVSPETAGIVGRLGGLAGLNLEGIYTRYEHADEQLERIAAPPASSSASGPARAAPRAACSASACRRRRRSRTSRRRARRTCSRPATTARSSPTAGCATAATSPRRSPAAPTP